MNLKCVAIACAVLMAGFTSCSNDSDTDNSGIVPNGNSTVAKITLMQKSNATRDADAKPGATPEESEIKTATLYVFNSEKKLVKQVNFPKGADTQTVELTTGTHYFYALVNSPKVPAIAANTPLEAATVQAVNEMNLASLEEINGTEFGFLMSSLGEPVRIDLVEAVESQAGTKNPVVLPVGRAMAKVNAKFEIADPETDQPITGALSQVQYQGANNPKAMYQLPNYVGGQLQTPYFKDASVVTNKYFPKLVDDFTMTDGWVDADGVEANAIYMIENSNQVPKEGNSSFILLKGLFTPKAEYCYDGQTGAPLGQGIPAGTTFWCAFTAEDPDFPVHKRRFYNQQPTASVLEELTTLLDDGYNYTLSVEYNNGITYYPFFLRNDAATNDIAKHTTARNSYYGVTITSVNNLGANTPFGVIPNPETPLGVIAWVEGTIEVLPWNVINQSGSIQ